MARKRHLLVVERLEQRHLLAAVPWFEDSGQALGSDHTALELGDLDGDGDLDAFFGCWGHSELPTVCSETQVWLNNGSGQFSKGWSDIARTGAAVALGDLDNDGDLDAYFTMATPACEPSEVWLNDGQGNFEDSGQRLTGCDIDVGLGDVDGDGDLDAVTAGVVTPSKVWLNDGAGEFTNSRQLLATDGWSYAVDLGDVDGDGDLDAWFGRGTDSPNHSDRVYFNDGTGNFSDSGQSLNSISTGDVALGDLDADGDLDAYLANSTWYGAKYPDRVWMNDGTGKFTDSGQRLGRSNGRWVGLGDLDGDGDLDAVVANGASLGTVRGEANVVWLNDGSGVFTVGQELGDAATSAVALGDIDNDGDVDALFANLGQDNQVWFNTQLMAGDANRDGVFNQLDIIQVLQSAKYQTGQPATWEEGDFNRDGVFDQLDIVAALQTGKYGQAEKEVPFKGSLSGTYTFVPDPAPSPFASVHLEATGNATQLGRFTLDAPHRVNLATLIATGTFELTAANGDKLTADFTGRATPTETPNVFSIVETATITGGTGRFAGATGSFTVERMVDLASPLATGSFDGTIVIPKG